MCKNEKKQSITTAVSTVSGFALGIREYVDSFYLNAQRKGDHCFGKQIDFKVKTSWELQAEQ